MPKKAKEYFEERDPKAMDYLGKLVPNVEFKQMIDEGEPPASESKPLTLEQGSKIFAEMRKALE